MGRRNTFATYGVNKLTLEKREKPVPRRIFLFVIIASVSIGAAPAQSPRVIWQRHVSSGPVDAIAFSPDGQLIAAGGEDGSVTLWRSSDGASLGTVSSQYDAAVAVAFSPDGGLLATGGLDRFIRVIRMQDLATLYTTGGGGFVESLSFSRDGRTLLGALGYSTNELAGFRVSDGEMTSIIRDHWGTVWSVDHSRDGRYFLTSGADGQVILYSSEGMRLANFSGFSGDCVTSKFSPDSSLVAAAGEYDWMVKIYDVPGRQTIKQLNVGHNFIHGVSFSSDGRYLAVAEQNYPNNGRIEVYRVSDGLRLGAYTEQTANSVGCIAFSPSGYIFAYGRSDGVLTLARLFPASPAPRTPR
jgi:WD40 repeat protein